MFRKGNNDIKALRNARDSITRSTEVLEKTVETFEEFSKDVSEAIKENRMQLLLHKKALLVVDERLKALEQKESSDDIMIV